MLVARAALPEEFVIHLLDRVAFRYDEFFNFDWRIWY